MLYVPAFASTNFVADTFGTTPTTSPGTAITSGTSGAEGSWSAALLTASFDIYGLWVVISDGSTTGQNRASAWDIGVDPAGGTAFVELIPDILAQGQGTFYNTPTVEHYFPVFIPSGATIAARGACAYSVAASMRVSLRAHGGGVNFPWAQLKGTHVETIGAGGYGGSTFTPGNAADGTWVFLGHPSQRLWWLVPSYTLSGAAITAEYTYITFAIGDASSKRIFAKITHTGTTAEVTQARYWPNAFYEGYQRVGPESTLYVMGRCNNAPDVQYGAKIIGIGG